MTEKDKTIKILNRLINHVTNSKIHNHQIKSNYFHDNFIHLTNYHQVSPIIHHFKKSIQSAYTFINEKILDKCQEAFLQNLCRSMLYIDFLKQKDLPDFFLVKGLVSAHLLYSFPPLRSYNDLDIYIKKEHYQDWMNFLTTSGFKKTNNITDIFPDKIINKYNFAQHFINRENNIAIDLHLNISNRMHPFQFDLEEFTAEPRILSIDGVDIKTFQNEYHLIYLLYHAFKHYYFKLIWFLDIHNFLASQSYDESRIVNLLKKYRLEKLFNYYLGISNDLFGTTGLGKQSLLANTFTPKTDKLINADTIIQGELKSQNSINRLFLPMKYLPGTTYKIKYLLQQAFPPSEILPEFYINDQNQTLFNYIKIRLSRLGRLEKIDI